MPDYNSPLLDLRVPTGLQNDTAAADWYARDQAARQSELKTRADTMALRNAQEWDKMQHQYMKEQDDEQAAGPAASAPAPAAAPPPTLPAAQPSAGTVAATAGAKQTGAAPSPLTAAVLPLHHPEVQAVIESAKPNDPQGAAKWDRALDELATRKVNPLPWATQYKGMYGKAKQMQEADAINSADQVASAAKSQLATAGAAATAAPPAAGTPAAAAAAPTVNPAQHGISPVTGKYSAALAHMMVMDPERTGKIVKLQAESKFQETGDMNYLRAYAPDTYRDIAAATTSMDEDKRAQYLHNLQVVGTWSNGVIEAGKRWGPDHQITLQTFRRAVVEMRDQGLITQQHAAEQLALKQVPWGEMAEGRSHATAVTKGVELEMQNQKEADAGTWSLIGREEGTGFGQYLNNKTGVVVTGDTVVGAKASAAQERKSAWQTKFDYYMGAHNGDRANAERFASSKTPMTAAQIHITAKNEALREQDLNQKKIDPDPNFNLATVTANNEADIRAALEEDVTPPAGSGPAGPGPAGTKPADPAIPKIDPNVHPVLRGYDPNLLAQKTPSGWTIAQAVVSRDSGMTRENVGKDRQHPYLVRNDADRDKVPMGAFYMAPNGVITTKKSK